MRYDVKTVDLHGRPHTLGTRLTLKAARRFTAALRKSEFAAYFTPNRKGGTDARNTPR